MAVETERYFQAEVDDPILERRLNYWYDAFLSDMPTDVDIMIHQSSVNSIRVGLEGYVDQTVSSTLPSLYDIFTGFRYKLDSPNNPKETFVRRFEPRGAVVYLHKKLFS